MAAFRSLPRIMRHGNRSLAGLATDFGDRRRDSCAPISTAPACLLPYETLSRSGADHARRAHAHFVSAHTQSSKRRRTREIGRSAGVSGAVSELFAWTVHAMVVFAPVRAQWPLPSLGADVVDLDVLSQLRCTLSRDLEASGRDKGGGGEESLALIASRSEEDAHITSKLAHETGFNQEHRSAEGNNHIGNGVTEAETGKVMRCGRLFWKVPCQIWNIPCAQRTWPMQR